MNSWLITLSLIEDRGHTDRVITPTRTRLRCFRWPRPRRTPRRASAQLICHNKTNYYGCQSILNNNHWPWPMTYDLQSQVSYGRFGLQQGKTISRQNAMPIGEDVLDRYRHVVLMLREWRPSVILIFPAPYTHVARARAQR